MDPLTMEIAKLFTVRKKNILVTGGSSGIGLMIAHGFIANGANVFIASRKGKRLAEVAAKLNKMGPGKATPIQADLSDEKGCAALATSLSAHIDKLHVLVNNSGATWGAPLQEYPEAAFKKLSAINSHAVFFLTRALLPLLKTSVSAGDGNARVINVASIDGIRVPTLPTWAYSSSKAACIALTKHMSMTLAEHKINVNAIAPGAFPSLMMEHTLREYGDTLSSTNPLGRIGKAEDMAGIAIYLSSPASDYVTGVVIPVDGGVLLTNRL